MAEVLFQVEKIVDGPNDKSQFFNSDKPLMTNIQFRHARMIQLVNNAEWKRAQQNSDPTFVDKSIPGPSVCKLKHY